MKTTILLIIMFIGVYQLSAQDVNYGKIPLIGDEAPAFKAESTNGPVSFPKDFGKNWKIIFSHPRAFTPVCSSEVLELSYLQDDYDKLGVKIIVLSTDTLNTYLTWKKALEDVKYKGNGPVKINFPLIADNTWEISKKYGMIHSKISRTLDVRSVFIIGPDNKIAAIFYYPNNIGRNMDEIKRTVIALQTSASTGLSTPANWQPGGDLIIPFPSEAQKKKMGSPDADVYQITWFMNFKKSK
jgi:peroxiredoxin (alkyl hydroperoxide reductase subunit C)